MALGLSNILVVMLATMSLGYFVCVKANKEQGFLKPLGLVLGSLIIIVTLLSTLMIIGLGFNKKTVMARPPASMATRPMMPQSPMMPQK